MSEPSQNPLFATTHWSVVLEAGRPGSPDADRALAELCRVYWYPLYAYVRRFGHSPEASKDLTQEFFARLLEKNYIGTADRKRGKFRWFLLTAFKCFLANEHDRSTALKRGGGQEVVRLDALEAEERYALEPVDSHTADQLFDLRWAMDVLDRVGRAVAAEYAEAGKSERYRALEQYLPGGEAHDDYATTAARLGMTEGAVKQEVHRLKKRYGLRLREEIAKTVASPEEVDDEIRVLIDVVCRR